MNKQVERVINLNLIMGRDTIFWILAIIVETKTLDIRTLGYVYDGQLPSQDFADFRIMTAG